MIRKGVLPLIIIGIISAAIAFFISGKIFKSAAHDSKAPQVEAIKADFPDVKHDSNYSTIFYEGAVDATQPVHIGSSSNKAPFNGQQ